MAARYPRFFWLLLLAFGLLACEEDSGQDLIGSWRAQALTMHQSSVDTSFQAAFERLKPQMLLKFRADSSYRSTLGRLNGDKHPARGVWHLNAAGDTLTMKEEGQRFAVHLRLERPASNALILRSGEMQLELRRVAE